MCYLQLVINKFTILSPQLLTGNIILPFVQIHLILKILRHTTLQSKFLDGGGDDDDDDDLYNNNNLHEYQGNIHKQGPIYLT